MPGCGIHSIHAGFVLMLGWFLVWGAWYALGFLPIIAGDDLCASYGLRKSTFSRKNLGKRMPSYRERVGMLLPRLTVKNPLRVTTSFLGFYAGLLAIQHGIFAMLQGTTAPDGLMFNAIGPPCQPEAVWHACFPAMTLIPNLLITGGAAVFAGLVIIVWGVAFAGRRNGGWVLGVLSILLLLVGGGFVPVFIGIITSLAAILMNNRKSHNNAVGQFISKLWPWTVLILALWLPGSWLLGKFFSDAMLSFSLAMFLFFDLGLPILCLLSAFSYDASRYDSGDNAEGLDTLK
jgi:hypothetical protein